MRVVIAPDSFKGTLDAPAAAAAIARGWAHVRPDDELVLVPLSDGGDGLLQVLAPRVTHAHDVEVTGPRGRPRPARVAVLDDGSAVVEVADACGLAWVAEDERDPMTATTIGVGDLLLAARATGASHALVGLGGSATVDGGIGALARLGAVLRDDAGRRLPRPRALDLERVAGVAGPASAWADVLVLGEGQLDTTSFAGKVLDNALDVAACFGVPASAVVGRRRGPAGALVHVEEAGADGPGADPAHEVATAAARLASRTAR